MVDHAPIVSAIADMSSALNRGRADIQPLWHCLSMNSDNWRVRLQDQLARDGRTMREVSLSAGLSAGYIHGILKDGKDPTIDRLAAVARALNVSLSFVLVGLNVSPQTEAIIQLLEKDPDRRAAMLRLLSADHHA